MTIAHYLFAFVGALFVEALYWYQLKERLHLEKYQRMLRSPVYWGVVGAFVLLSALVAIAWGRSAASVPTELAMAAAGAGADGLLKAVVGAGKAAKNSKLGPASDRFTIDDYLFPG